MMEFFFFLGIAVILGYISYKLLVIVSQNSREKSFREGAVGQKVIVVKTNTLGVIEEIKKGDSGNYYYSINGGLYTFAEIDPLIETTHNPK